MSRARHSEEQVASALEKFESGMALPELCKQFNISLRTFYRWKASHDANRGNAAGRAMKELAEENSALKAVVAELILENRALREGLGRSRNPRTDVGPAER